MNEDGYEQFARELVKKRGGNPDSEAGKKTVKKLAEATENWVVLGLVQSMDERQKAEFDKLLDDEDGDLNEFFVVEGIDLKGITEDVYKKVSDKFLGGKDVR